METMQMFYAQLFSAESSRSTYLSCLLRLTQLRHDQIAPLEGVLWWNGWGFTEK